MLKIEDFKFSSSSIDETMFDRPVRARTASSGVVRIASASDLAGFSRIAHDKLVHLSQKDFWKIGQDNEGFFIERLVDDGDGPLSEG